MQPMVKWAHSPLRPIVVNDTFDPKARDANQWKVWLKDGTRLYGRAFSGWGLLMALIYVGLGYLDIQNDVAGMLVIAFSGVLQLSHLAVIEQMRSGHVGVMATARAVKTLWSEHRALLGRTILVRGMVTFVLMGLTWGITHLVAWLILSHASPAASAPQEAIPTWVMVWLACGHVWGLAMLPLFFQLGGTVSMVLPLLREGVDLPMARRLDVLATQRNASGAQVLRMVFVFAGLNGAFLFPPLLPLLAVWWMAVTQCMYADVFERGSKIEVMAKVHRDARAPALAPVPIGR